MRYTTTLVLFLVAAALGAYVYFVERHASTSDQVEAERVKLVPGFDPQAATRITVTHPGAPEVRLEREAGTAWQLTAPVKARAAGAAIAELLSAVEFLEFRARVPDQGAQRRAEYGLTPPQAQLRVQVRDREIALAMGHDDASGQGVYATRAGDATVYVVEKRFRELLLRGLDALRDRQVFGVESAHLKSLRIDGAVLTREQGRWHLASPQRMRAAEGKVEELLGTLLGLKVRRWVEAAPAAPAGAGRTVVLTDERDHAVTVGGVCPGQLDEVLLRRGAPEEDSVCVAKADLDRLPATVDGLQDLRVLPFRPEEVHGLTINAGGRELKLARQGLTWKIVAPAGATADDEVIRKWVEDFGSYRALSVDGLDAPRPTGVAITVTVQGEGAAHEVITISPSRDGRRWVRRGDEALLLQVHAEAGDMVSADPLSFRARQVVAVPRWEARTISITADGVTEVAERGAGDAWQLKLPTVMDADSGVVDRLLGALGNVRAERFLLPTGGTPFARSWVVRVDTQPVEHEGGARPDGGARRPASHTIEVGADTADGYCHGRVAGAVMVLAKGVCHDLRVHLASRKLLDFGNLDLTSITLTRGARVETLEKRGPDWHRAAGPRVPPESIEEILGTLRRAEAREVLRYGGESAGVVRLEVKLRAEGGRELMLQLLGDVDGGVKARVAGRDVTYLVATATAEQLEKLVP